MSILRNLIPGQYQIDDLVFGKGTTVRVETIDIKPYDINSQDYQVTRADEMRFGWDQLKPTTIDITFHVLKNHLRPGFEDLIPNFWKEMPTVSQFQTAWRADDLRYSWGEMKPLYICGEDGITRAVYGRPGQFTYAKDTTYTEDIQCLGEFRRADTLAYTAQETGVIIDIGTEPSYIMAGGDAPAFLRILMEGPITNPVVTIGTQQIQLNLTLDDGEVLEVSSYPWQRRIVDSNRVNHSADMIGDTKYLDALRLPAQVPVAIRWTSDEYNTFIPALGSQKWAEDIDSTGFFTLPSTFTPIVGQVVIGFDYTNLIVQGIKDFEDFIIDPALLTISSFINTVTEIGKFLRANLFGETSAVIYNAKKYLTANQTAQARIVVPFLGRSGIVIMSNVTMTNFVILEIEVDVLTGSRLNIKTGSGFYNGATLSEAKATWTVPFIDDIVQLFDTDVMKFVSTQDAETGIVTYTGYYNGDEKLSWTDTDGIVGTGSDNRYNGYIFNCDAALLLQGTGFADLMAWDSLEVPTPVGRVAVLWQDAWGVIE